MPDFTATVTCGDWDGTAAADDLQPDSLSRYLQAERLIGERDFLIAVSLTIVDASMYLDAFVYLSGTDGVSIAAVIANTRGPIPVRKMKIPLTVDEFVKLFKRFSIMLTRSSVGLEGREYRVIEA